MTAPVVVVREPGRVALHLVLHERLEVGRDCAGLLLDDPQVSRRHVELVPTDGGVEVRDLDSRNGSLLDGARLQAPGVLAPGAVLRIGDTTVQLAGTIDPAARPDTGSDRADMTSIELVADDVVAERSVITAADPTTDQGTVTIVFSDIESSTQRAVELGDARWFEVLNRHNAVVRHELARARGTEIKAQGDGFMLTFRGARRALECMMAVQRHITAEFDDPAEGPVVRVRVGVHTGEVIIDDDGDLFGRHVNMAARVANEAHGGEILVSSLVREIVETRGDLEFGEPRTVQLKGLPGAHLVHPLRWDRASDRERVRTSG